MEGLAHALGPLGADTARRLGEQLGRERVLAARVDLEEGPRRLEHLGCAQLAHGEPLLDLDVYMCVCVYMREVAAGAHGAAALDWGVACVGGCMWGGLHVGGGCMWGACKRAAARHTCASNLLSSPPERCSRAST